MKFFIIIKQHSVRVPNKNFLDLGGIPLWHHLINELENEDVFIDTDSKVVLNDSKGMNWVYAYKRDKKFIDLEKYSVSPVLLMIENFIDKYITDEDEIIVTPHVTSPFIKKKTILKASAMLDLGYDSIQACTKHHEFCYFNNNAVNFDPNIVQKTQDLEPVIMGNGAFFIFTAKTFKKYKNRTGENPYFYPLNFKESIEIDTPEDFEIAKRFIQ